MTESHEHSHEATDETPQAATVYAPPAELQNKWLKEELSNEKAQNIDLRMTLQFHADIVESLRQQIDQLTVENESLKLRDSNDEPVVVTGSATESGK